MVFSFLPLFFPSRTTAVAAAVVVAVEEKSFHSSILFSVTISLYFNFFFVFGKSFMRLHEKFMHLLMLLTT
jgi:hypothetical protein